ncbi:MAG: hypothetical protein IPM25_07170 [Chloracidobacterium sp.]|nr:hypothetical protein [Chloracidobacterium sp.]
MPRDVGIAFVTGRKQFQVVLRSYVNNWLEHGLIQDRNVRLHLFVVYDTAYSDTTPDDYRSVPPELSSLVGSINFYGRTALRNERRKLIDEGVIDEQEGELLFGEGYAKKRNAALYFAVQKGMDSLLFIDDDEYPLAVFDNRPNNLMWMGQSILGTHLRYSDKADITHGHHCGYISPIPRFEFNNLLTESDFRAFVEATSNDIISWRSVKEIVFGNDGVTYADRRVIEKASAEDVVEVNGMKFISGANLCLNLRRIKNVPAFYNPPGARGEDAFMSTTLSDLRVLKVPCFTFHDAFLEYPRLLNGILPTRISGVDALSPAIRQRFVRASVGWIRYKPLLVCLTNPHRYRHTLDEMKRKLDRAIPKMIRYFQTEKFEEVRTELDRYDKNVLRHHRAFLATLQAWRKVIGHVRSGGTKRDPASAAAAKI